jgi:hypothetical protein
MVIEQGTRPGAPDPHQIVIAGHSYQLAESPSGRPIHESYAQGRELRETWDFQQPSFGMGEVTRQTPNGCYFTEGIDTTGRGLRIQPKVNTIAMAAGDIPTGKTGVFFETRDTGGNRRIYFYCDIDADTIRLTKFNATAFTRITGASQPLDVTVATSALLSAGRPAEFEGYWYTCFGCFNVASVHSLKQLTSCVTGTGADTWTTIDTMPSAVDFLLPGTAGDGRINLIRHTGERYIQTCASNASGDGPLDNANWAPSPGHRVGNTMPVLGGANAGGIMYLAKPDGLFTFDAQGNSWSVIPFTAPLSDSNTTSQNPRHAMHTFAFGDAVFFPHSSGLWRVIGLSRTKKADPDSIPGYAAVPNISPPLRYEFHGGTFVGEWLYFIYTDTTNNNSSYLLCCRIGPHPSGHPLIVHTLLKRPNEMRTLHADEANVLWWSEPGQDRVAYIQLASDGSPSAAVRGAASTATYEWYGGEVDFGEPEVAKQLRYAFVEVEAGDATVSWQLKMHYDGDSAVNIGSAITTTEATHISPTAGTNDSFRRARPRFTVTGTGDHDAADPKCLRLTLIARTPDTMRVVITSSTLQGRLSLFEIAKELRWLKNAGPQTIGEPGTNEDFTGYIRSVNIVPAGIEVLYDRWQIAA